MNQKELLENGYASIFPSPIDIPKVDTKMPQYDDATGSFILAGIDKLAGALSKAQGEFGGVAKDGVNPHFKTKYATLASVLDAVKAPLAANGLALVQLIQPEGLVTVLMHESGQSIQSVAPLPQNALPQVLGSALTYMRRYSVMAMLSVAADDDDDGNAAQTVTGMVPTRRAPSKPKPEPEPEQETEAQMQQRLGLRGWLREMTARATSLKDIEALRDNEKVGHGLRAASADIRAEINDILRTGEARFTGEITDEDRMEA